MKNPTRPLLLVWLLLPLTSAWSQPSTLEWVQRFPPTSPPPEYGTAATYDSKRQVMVMWPEMVYDSQREVIVLFGGVISGVTLTNMTDVWEWNGSQWSLQTAAGVGGRDLPAVAYDSSRKEIVRFGGNDDVNRQFTVYADTWILRLRETWVDFTYTGNETGEFATPFNTPQKGVDFAPPGTITEIKAGSTPETLLLINPVTIEAIGGPVTLGK